MSNHCSRIACCAELSSNPATVGDLARWNGRGPHLRSLRSASAAAYPETVAPCAPLYTGRWPKWRCVGLTRAEGQLLAQPVRCVAIFGCESLTIFGCELLTTSGKYFPPRRKNLCHFWLRILNHFLAGLRHFWLGNRNHVLRSLRHFWLRILNHVCGKSPPFLVKKS